MSLAAEVEQPNKGHLSSPSAWTDLTNNKKGNSQLSFNDLDALPRLLNSFVRFSTSMLYFFVVKLMSVLL